MDFSFKDVTNVIRWFSVRLFLYNHYVIQNLFATALLSTVLMKTVLLVDFLIHVGALNQLENALFSYNLKWVE